MQRQRKEIHTRKANMNKYIRIQRGQTPVLAAEFGVSKQYVWYALHYVKNGPTAVKIRKAALEMGGVYVESNFVPTCQFEKTATGFQQIFADDVRLIVDVKASTAEITHRGKSVARVDEVTLDAWGALAMEAQQLGQTGRIAIPVA